MNPLIDNPPQQNTRQWSARLGILAAQKAAPVDLPTRMSAILHSLRRRQHADDTLKANHFILGD